LFYADFIIGSTAESMGKEFFIATNTMSRRFFAFGILLPVLALTPLLAADTAPSTPASPVLRDPTLRPRVEAGSWQQLVELTKTTLSWSNSYLLWIT
jgi:hypothetical protein